jgi:nucleotide-binding universal stress UspA family protein
LSVLNDSETDFKRITVPTDGSDISFEALPLAHSLAVKQNSEIDLLSISKADFTHIMAGENTPYVHKDAEIKEYIFKALQEFIKSKTSQLYFKEEPISSDETFQLKDQKGNNVRISIVVKKGNSAHLAVVDYAEKNAQLVVMATHGYSKLTSMFVGSTTESVFRNLKIPILTVKPDFAK